MYLSDFFERNRGAYYDALTVVRTSSNLTHWIKFFLTAIIETATKGKETFRQILKLREEVEHRILSLGKRAENAKHILIILYQRPILSVADVVTALNVTHPTASKLITLMIDLNILKEMTGQQRNRIYVFEDYLKLFGD